MLTGTTMQALKAAYLSALDLLAIPAELTRAGEASGTSYMVGFKTASLDDTEVINAYGIGAKIITFKADDFTTTPPAKFDALAVHGERYTLDAVQPLHLGAEIIFYKAYAKGL